MDVPGLSLQALALKCVHYHSLFFTQGLLWGDILCCAPSIAHSFLTQASASGGPPAQGDRCLLQGGKDDCLSCSEDMKGQGRAGVSSPDMLSVPVSSCSLLFSAAWVWVSLHAVGPPSLQRTPLDKRSSHLSLERAHFVWTF